MELTFQTLHLVEYKYIITTYSPAAAARRQFIYRLLENYFYISDSIILFISGGSFVFNRKPKKKNIN